jgi:hypothetical protein
MLYFIAGIITAGYHGNHKKYTTSDYKTNRASERWLQVTVAEISDYSINFKNWNLLEWLIN